MTDKEAWALVMLASILTITIGGFAVASVIEFL